MTPDQLPDPLRVALNFAETLEQLGVPYFAAGSLASSVHGEPRSTDDIDFVADLRPNHVAALVAALAPEYYLDPDAVRDAVARGDPFNAIHLATAVKVDVFVAGTDVFDAERMARREAVQIWSAPPRQLYVDTAEHTVLRKLEWYRRGGGVSDRQWRDVLGVLRAQGARLDRVRLAEWASRLGLEELLERALRESHG